MPDLYAIFLIGTALSLCSWLTFDNKWRISGLFQAVFYISLTAYIFMIIGQGLNPKSLTLLLFRDLIFLSGVSAIFILLRKNTFISFFFLIGLYAATPQIYHYLAKSSKEKPTTEISGEWEIMMELHPGQDLTSLNKIVKFWDLDVKPAFQPKFADVTDLDDYYKVGIPRKNERKIAKIMSQLERFPAVEWVEKNEILRLDPVEAGIQKKKVELPAVNDPFIDNQWAFGTLEMNDYYRYLTDNQIQPAKKAKLFIIDTGVDAGHEDLNSYYQSIDKSFDQDEIGHGTHCAGIASSVTNNGIGVASLIPDHSYVELTGIKVFNKFGFATQKMVIDGIIKAVDSGADVISLSLGGRSTQAKEKAYNEVMQYAKNHGAIVIAAAGNASMDASRYSPANSQNIIAVAAVDENLERTNFSNTLENIEFGLAAPGKDIYSTYPGDQYKSMSGTSMSAPFVSGLVAMMKSIQPDITLEQVYHILYTTGENSTMEPEKTGKIVQPYEAIRNLIETRPNEGI